MRALLFCGAFDLFAQRRHVDLHCLGFPRFPRQFHVSHFGLNGRDLIAQFADRAVFVADLAGKIRPAACLRVDRTVDIARLFHLLEQRRSGHLWCGDQKDIAGRVDLRLERLRVAVDIRPRFEVTPIVEIDFVDVDIQRHHRAQRVQLLLRLGAREGQRIERQRPEQRVRASSAATGTWRRPP